MALQAPDGAWISSTRVVKVECSACGPVLVTTWPQNDREIEGLLRDHAITTHPPKGA